MRATQNEHGPQPAARVTFVSREGGIRTLGTVTRTQHFQCCTIDHSVTAPAAHPSPANNLAMGSKADNRPQQRTVLRFVPGVPLASILAM